MPTSQPVALITGGAKRVGKAVVQRLHDAGYAVAFTYLSSQPEARALAAQVRGHAIQADLTQPERAAESLRRAFPFDRLDVLVNCASLYLADPGAGVDLAAARRMMAVHFESPLLLCSTFEDLLRSARGHVVNFVDLLAERPWPKYSAYCASKAALLNLTLSLARKLAPDVTVNAIAPGVIEWPEDYPQEQREKYLQRVPLHRAGTPQDAANLVHFLASEGSYITGQILRLDGGRSIT